MGWLGIALVGRITLEGFTISVIPEKKIYYGIDEKNMTSVAIQGNRAMKIAYMQWFVWMTIVPDWELSTKKRSVREMKRELRKVKIDASLIMGFLYT